MAIRCQERVVSKNVSEWEFFFLHSQPLIRLYEQNSLSSFSVWKSRNNPSLNWSKNLLVYWRLWTGKTTHPKQWGRKKKGLGTRHILHRHTPETHIFNKVPLSIDLPPHVSPCKLLVIGGLNHWPGRRSDLTFSANVPTNYSETCVSKLLGFSQSNELNKQDHHHLEEQSLADTKIKQAAEYF